MKDMITARRCLSSLKNDRVGIKTVVYTQTEPIQRTRERLGKTDTCTLEGQVIFVFPFFFGKIFVIIIVVFVSSGFELGLVLEWDHGYRRIGIDLPQKYLWYILGTPFTLFRHQHFFYKFFEVRKIALSYVLKTSRHLQLKSKLHRISQLYVICNRFLFSTLVFGLTCKSQSHNTGICDFAGVNGGTRL